LTDFAKVLAWHDGKIICRLKLLTPTPLNTYPEGFLKEATKSNPTAEKQPTLPQFLIVEEAAELLRVKPKTVHTWISQRRIPVRYAGGRPVFLLEELLAWTLPENDGWEAHRLRHAGAGKMLPDRLTANRERRNPDGSL
jgi:hypothetical protein